MINSINYEYKFTCIRDQMHFFQTKMTKIQWFKLVDAKWCGNWEQHSHFNNSWRVHVHNKIDWTIKAIDCGNNMLGACTEALRFKIFKWRHFVQVFTLSNWSTRHLDNMNFDILWSSGEWSYHYFIHNGLFFKCN